LIFAQQLSKQSELLFSSSATALISLKLMLGLLPAILIITLPFSLLIGSLMALNRLSSDSEIVAARAGGISLLAIALPIVSLGIIGSILSGVCTLYLIPRVTTEAKKLKGLLVLQALTTPIRPKTFDTHFKNHLLYVDDVDKVTGNWLGVFILRKSSGKENVVLTAKEGKLRLTDLEPISIEIELNNGVLVSSSDTQPEKQNTVRFEHQKIPISEENPAFAKALEKGKLLQELSLGELLKQGNSISDKRTVNQALTEWHKRLALPFACALLVILAIPFGTASSRKGGKAVAFAFGFGLAILYYLLLLAGQNLALTGAVPAWLGIWLPNIVGLLSLLSFQFSPALTSNKQKKTLHLDDKRTGLSISAKPVRFSLFSTARSLGINLVNFLLLSELLKFFIFSMVILVGTSLIFTLFDLIPSIAKNNVEWSYTLTYLGYLSPQLAYYVAPFALLLALLSAHGVLSKSHQITAMLTHGVSRLRIAFPVILGALVVMSVLFWVSEDILPTSNREQDFRYNTIKDRKTETTISFADLNWVKSSNGSIYGYQLNPVNNYLLNTSVFSLNKEKLLAQITQADSATKTSDNSWNILNGWSFNLEGNSKEDFNRIVDGGYSSAINIPEGISIFRRLVNEASKMDFLELKKYITYLSDFGASTTSLRVDLEKKLAFPFSCIPLLMVAFPLALKNAGKRNAGTLAGIGLSLLIGFSYWIIGSLFESAGRQAFLPPGLSVWGAHALFLAVGLFLIFRRN
jgi:LPS export ABC transporter permease LptG/LPS export ABC transporter permease LptF